MSYVVTQKIDAKGSMCPGPLMELVRAIKHAEVGDILELVSTDNGSKSEIPKWCTKAGHELLDQFEDDGDHYVIKKGEKIRRKRRKERK